MSDNGYYVKFDLTDEWGKVEQWELRYRRITTDLFLQLTGDIEGRELARRITDNFDELVWQMHRNGELVLEEAWAELPMEVEVEVYMRHPSFRPVPKNEEPV